MKILVIGGTRYFGIPMVKKLIQDGNKVSIATRGITPDTFGSSVNRIQLDLKDESSVRNSLKMQSFDVVIDKIAYSSNEIKWILESVDCNRFVHMSTAGVYTLDRFNIREEEFDGHKGTLIWCNRNELSYDDVKRNAERALCQVYNNVNWVSLRVPFVMGKNDYTKRLRFYVEHILQNRPMFIDNLTNKFCVAYCEEISDLLIMLAKNTFHGSLNACSDGLVTIEEIVDYIEQKTGIKPIYSTEGDAAPYNGTNNNSLDTERAKKMGFQFSEVHTWIYQLIDYYIDEVTHGIG